MSPFEWLVVILLVVLAAIAIYIAYGILVLSRSLQVMSVQNKTLIAGLDRVGSYANETGVEVKRVNAHLRGKR